MRPDFELLPPESTDAESLGLTIARYLSRDASAFVGRQGEGMSALLMALKLRSFGQYVKGLSSVEIERDGDSNVRAIPMENAGPREGLLPREDAARSLRSGYTMPELGALVLEFLPRT